MGDKPANDKKAYPLRINASILEAVQRWADAELRSANAQIEYVLRDALRRAGRLPRANDGGASDGGASDSAVDGNAADEHAADESGNEEKHR